MKRIIIFIFYVQLLLLFSNCSCDHKKSPGNPLLQSDQNIETSDEGDKYSHNNKLGSNSEDVCDYIPTRLYIPRSVTFEEALLQSQLQLRKLKTINCVGGAKLIAEMSADVSGIHSSSDDVEGRTIRIYPMHILKLRISSIPTSLFNLASHQEIIIESCIIESTSSIFDDHFRVSLALINNTRNTKSVIIEKGTMIESEACGAQNIVVSDGREVSLRPQERVDIRVRAFCASHHRSSPSGTRGRITPYVLNAPDVVYQSQQSIWDYQEAPSRNKITFFVWKKGTDTGNGHKSPTGHAFVYIPRYGYWGYGSGDGNLLNGKGSIFDHSQKRQYATDSCSVYITDLQLRKVYDKLNNLRNDTPRYHIGKYDCTSFTMDIADAAEVYYGLRSLIQTPVGFMEQLKKYN